MTQKELPPRALVNPLRRWLDPRLTDPATLCPLLVPCPPERLRVWPVSPAVNRPGAEGPDLMAPVMRPEG